MIRGCVNEGFILAQLVARILVPLSMAGVRDRRFDFEAEKWNKWKMGLGGGGSLPALFTLQSLA